jgi:hypothetical protein
LNLRPSGYEPDELPDCSTPHRKSRLLYPVASLMQEAERYFGQPACRSLAQVAPIKRSLLQGSLTEL